MEQRIIKFRIWKPEHKRMDSVRIERYFGGRGLYDQNTGCDTGIWLQYTGLQDVNGKDIYEGDIYHHGEPKILYVVEWHDTGFKGRQVSNKSTAGLTHWQDRIQIIGNVFENPELLTPTTPQP
jgi:hypothetical protein